MLAEKLQDVQAKNMCAEAFIISTWTTRKDNKWYTPSTSTVKVLYDGTATGSTLRRMLVDIHAHAVTHKLYSMSGFPQELLTDLVLEMNRARVSKLSSKRYLKYGDDARAYLEPEDKGQD